MSIYVKAKITCDGLRGQQCSASEEFWTEINTEVDISGDFQSGISTNVDLGFFIPDGWRNTKWDGCLCQDCILKEKVEHEAMLKRNRKRYPVGKKA